MEVYVLLSFGFSILILVMVMLFAWRWQRERHRTELQKAILERVGSVKDFAEFLTTEQGERFLGSLAPKHFQAHDRSLWSVRVGVVLLTIGVFLMGALHSTVFGNFGNTPPKPLLLALLLLIGAGTGMLLSAAVSFVIARGLGLDRRGGDTGKDRAV